MPSTGTSRQPSGKHWIKYVRWDVIQAWRHHAMRSSAGQLAYPFAYGSTEKAMPDIEGGVLWLISAPRYGRYRMPPSLIARLDVRAVVRPDSQAARSVDTAVLKHARREHDRQQGWVALAQRGTRAYLPLNNALHMLQQLSFLGRVERLPEPGTTRPGPGRGIYSRIPMHFQQHRVVHPRSVHTLEDFAAAVRAGRRAFISYRWDDFDEDSRWLSALSDALEAGQVSCWWDRWHVPKQDKPIETRLLADILCDAVRQSSWFIALMRPAYSARRNPSKPLGRDASGTWQGQRPPAKVAGTPCSVSPSSSATTPALPSATGWTVATTSCQSRRTQPLTSSLAGYSRSCRLPPEPGQHPDHRPTRDA